MTQPVLPSPDGLGEGRSARALGGTAHLSDVAFPQPIILHIAFQTMKVRQSSACSLPSCTWFGRLCQVRPSDRVLSSCLRFHPPLVGAGETGPTLLASLARSLAEGISPLPFLFPLLLFVPTFAFLSSARFCRSALLTFSTCCE